MKCRASGSVLSSIISHSVPLLEQHKSPLHFSLAIQTLRLLLSTPYTSRRRQYWLERLCINLRHVGRVGEAVDAAERGRDEAVAAGHVRFRVPINGSVFLTICCIYID